MTTENTPVPEKKPRATKTPRTVESITNGALQLQLSDRVALLKALKESVSAEVKNLETKAAEAKQTVNGL